MQYQVRVDDVESSVIVETFSELGQAVDCYVLQILALSQADVEIQLVQLIGEDDECVPITSHIFVWTDPHRILKTFELRSLVLGYLKCHKH